MTQVIRPVVAFVLLAAPSLAELSRPGKTIPKGAYTITPYPGDAELPERGAPDIYDNVTFGPPSYHINNVGMFVGDDLHMAGTTVTSFRWVYTDGGSYSPHSSSVAFFHNTPGDAGPLLGNTVTFVSGTMVYDAVFNVTGLPQDTPNNPNGGWLISVPLPALVTGPDIWVGLSSNSATPQGTGIGFRSGLRGGGVQTVPGASSHNLHWSGFFSSPPTTAFFSRGGTDTGNFRMAVGGVPEPAVGLAIGRRRIAGVSSSENVKLKHVVGLFVAVSMVALPAMAEHSHPGRTIPKGAYTIEPFLGEFEGGGTRGIDPTPIYSIGGGFPTPYHVNNAGRFVGDDVHMAGTTITSIRWVYTDGGTGGASGHSSSIAFFYNNANDAGPILGNTVTFVSGTQTYGAVFNVTGLPQASANNPNGGWIITVGLPALVTGLNAWVGINSNSTTPTGAPGPGFRPGLRGGGVSTVAGASSHNLHWSGFFTGPTATSFFSTPGMTGNFRWQLGGMPEPAAAALMAFGGVLALRRRRV